MTSIIIPVYNNLELTKQCIESIEKHTKDYEIIIVDDCSTDGTHEYFKDKYKYLRNDKNLGFSQTCNKGILATDNDVVLLNNDTKVTENWLSEMLKVDAGIVGSCLLFPNTNLIQHCGVKIGTINNKPFPFHPNMFTPIKEQKVERVRAVTGACMLIRREVINEIGLLREYRNGFEDIDYCLRAKDVAYCGKSIVYHYESMSEGRHDYNKENYQKFIDNWGHIKRDFNEQETRNQLNNINQEQMEQVHRIKANSINSINWVGEFDKLHSFSIINNKLKERLRFSKYSDIEVRHTYPPIIKDTDKYLIYMQPWEYTQLTKDVYRALKTADEIWTPSRVGKIAMDNAGLKNVHIIPNGTDFTPEGTKYPIESNKFKFLFVGGTIWRKGIDILLEAFIGLDATLVIKDMGTNSFYKNGSKEDILKLKDKLDIVYIDDNIDINSLYRACDCLVMPYRAEGFCMPVLEAMASGITVIATDGIATEYMEGYRIKSEIKTIEDNNFLAPFEILEPDVNHLRFLMEKAMNEPIISKSNLTWDLMASRIEQRIKEIKKTL